MSSKQVEMKDHESKKHLLEVLPHELKFTFEVKKQSTCAVRLTNTSDQYVAFKVKTTSPKKYCVRPNIGIVKPKSTCDFTVTMQAQKSAPLDLLCKDKFLIQSAIAPFGTSEEDITPGMFAKDCGKYIEECKLRVVLSSPSHSPVLSPVNGVSKQEQSHGAPTEKEKVLSGLENFAPQMPVDNIEDTKPVMDTEESKSTEAVENVHSPSDIQKLNHDQDVKSRPLKDAEGINFKFFHSPSDVGRVIPDQYAKSEKLNNVENPNLKLFDLFADVAKLAPEKDMEGTKLKLSDDNEERPMKDVEGTKLKLSGDAEELKSKFNMLDLKLVQAELTITKLKEEKNSAIQEKEKLKEDLAMLRRKIGVRQVQQGFPPLFVCMVALISLAVGFLLHA